jgi:hypothetical protein
LTPAISEEIPHAPPPEAKNIADGDKLHFGLGPDGIQHLVEPVLDGHKTFAFARIDPA